ncbi:uncharacterized protein LOC128133664 [Lactuca sativa]|uniref:uncharacterized protein LOC128133664 n=1 Tax=Lactuca sativa TaxID=4236 RepID=UPI0022AEF834|nr:uncharacterized protein LOC128133664 [Lactuca sativa]
MVVVSTVKAHEQFKAYSLAKLVGILKSHESEVSKETNVVSSMGSLALISKGKNVVEKEVDLDLSEYDLTSEDFALMGNTVDDEFGGVEVWSTDSEDEEVRKPTHGRALLVKEEQVTRKCLMVTSEVSQMRGYTTDKGRDEAKEREDRCFAAKPVNVQINECNELIKKDDDMSEISIEDEVECSEFFKSESKTNKNLISENSVEFTRSTKDKTKVLKAKAVVYQKVKTTPNQVYIVQGVTQQKTAELTTLVEEDSADGCNDFLWLASIDNADETEGLSQKISWRVKAYRVLSKSSKKIEETYYVTFDDNYVKKLKATEGSVEEIFPISGQVTIPISNLFEQYMLLFEEPETAIHSESKDVENKVDQLKKLIVDTTKKMADQQPQADKQSNSCEPPRDSSYVQGEGSYPPNNQDSSFQGENPSSSTESQVQGKYSKPEPEEVSSFEGENENSNDDDIQSELEEVDSELDPSYDPNYPPLTKWTKDHPQTQIIGKPSEKRKMPPRKRTNRKNNNPPMNPQPTPPQFDPAMFQAAVTAAVAAMML